MGKHVRIIDFRKLDPCRTAAGKLGQRTSSCCYAVDQFAGLLHNGQISSKIGVQNIVHSQGAQQGHHLSLDKAALLHAKLLSQCRTHGRGGGYNHDLVRVHNLCGHHSILRLFPDALHRTDIGALPAVDADGGIPCF